MFQIPVVVADQEIDRAVRSVEPSFEHAGDRFTGVAIRPERQERRLRLRATGHSRRNDNGRSHDGCGREP